MLPPRTWVHTAPRGQSCRPRGSPGSFMSVMGPAGPFPFSRPHLHPEVLAGPFQRPCVCALSPAESPR